MHFVHGGPTDLSNLRLYCNHHQGSFTPRSCLLPSERRRVERCNLITVQQFATKWTGVGVNPDHDPDGFQCVELANEWCIQIGIEELGGNAVDFAFDPHPDCD